MSAGIIALIVLAVFVFIVAASGVRIVPQARAGVVERLGRYARTLEPGLTLIIPFVDRVKPLIDLREQVVTFPPQPVITEDNLVVGIDTVIYFTVTDAEGRDLRGRQPAAGDRAAHRHHAAQRDRRAHARGDADQPRQHQLAAARRARRGDRPLGHPRQPRRAQVGRAAAHGAGGDGEADARRARPPRDDPHRRGRQAVADPHRRGREAGGGAQGRGRPHVGDPARRGRVEGDRDRLPGDPRRRARPAAAPLPVPADAAPARAGRGEQDLRDPERVQPGARQHRQRARPVRRRRRGPAAAEAQAAPERPRSTRSTRRPQADADAAAAAAAQATAEAEGAATYTPPGVDAEPRRDRRADRDRRRRTARAAVAAAAPAAPPVT